MKMKYFASVPYAEAASGMERIAGRGLGLEIAVTDPHWILDVCELPVVARLGESLAGEGFRVNVQGPFYDLSPGSLDPFIREHSGRLFVRAIEIAGALGAENIVFYSGYNPLQHASVLEQWFQVSLPVWRETVEAAERHDVRVLISNMFEEAPDIQQRLIEDFPSEAAGACLDVANAFSAGKKKLSRWINVLGERLATVHLSDSRGADGEHLTLGQGKVPLRELFQALMRKRLQPDIVFRMDPVQALESLRILRQEELGQYQIELL